MGKILNLWSFILCLVCLVLFFLFSSVVYLKELVISWTGVHPLLFILYLTLIDFFLGVIGFFGISSPKTAARSFFTVLFSLGLSIVLTFTIFVGKILE